MELLTLNNGLQIPALGFGTYKAGLDEINSAVEEGCTYFDTASYYGNEGDISLALEQTHTERGKILIASKLWKSDMGYDNTMKAFARTLENLKCDYVDVYMIHWPRPNLVLQEWEAICVETWRAMEELYSQGKIRALGLSNFLPYHAEIIMKNCRVIPSVAQIEFHPGHLQAFTLEYYRRKGIQVQAWSPMGRGRVLNDELICELAGKYHVTPAQVCLRFCVQEGVMPLPKASTHERIRENLGCMDFVIDERDMSRIENMPPLGWSGEHPDRERVKIV